MPVTAVSICNSALVKMGADRISSITEDTKRAIVCNTIFNLVRDDVLRSHPWNFAIKRAVLAPNGATPDFGYAHQYDKPTDMLRPLPPDPTQIDTDVEWVEEGEKILSDESELNMRYIFRNEDPSTWDSCFAEAFAWRLARDLAYNLTQSMTLVTSCEEGFKKKMAEARSMDSIDGVRRRLTADTWTNARR